MSFARSHVVVLLVITVPILIGIFYGSGRGKRLLPHGYSIPITTDPRHPVEVYIAPLFVRTHQRLSVGTTVPRGSCSDGAARQLWQAVNS